MTWAAWLPAGRPGRQWSHLCPGLARTGVTNPLVQQFLGATKATWGDLTESDLAQTEGKRAALVALVQAKYGVASGEAVRQVNHWRWSYQVKANQTANRMHSQAILD